MSRTDYDVIIVGAGPAGLSAWLHLNALAPELAKQTLMLEKAVHPRDKLCGGGITPLGDMLLRGIGLEMDCPAVEVDQLDFQAGAALLPFHHANALRIVSRRTFDAALARAAHDRGLELRQDEAVNDLDWHAEFVRLRTTRGEYSARVVVGCDGAHSIVRQRMNLADESRLARLIEVAVRVEPEGDPEFSRRAAVFDFSAAAHGLQGYVWHFPFFDGNGMPAVSHGIYDSRVHPERARSDLRALLAESLRQRGIASSLEWKSHPVRWFSPGAQCARPRAFLAGDAAGVDALLGEGITPSLDYGDFAANLLIDAFDRGDFSFADHRERFLAHPLGQSLQEKYELARQTYAEGGVEAGQLPAVMLRLIGQG